MGHSRGLIRSDESSSAFVASLLTRHIQMGVGIQHYSGDMKSLAFRNQSDVVNLGFFIKLN